MHHTALCRYLYTLYKDRWNSIFLFFKILWWIWPQPTCWQGKVWMAAIYCSPVRRADGRGHFEIYRWSVQLFILFTYTVQLEKILERWKNCLFLLFNYKLFIFRGGLAPESSKINRLSTKTLLISIKHFMK